MRKMTKNVKNWGVEKLKSYLIERKVPVGNRTKQGLINFTVFTRKMGLGQKCLRKPKKSGECMNASHVYRNEV